MGAAVIEMPVLSEISVYIGEAALTAPSLRTLRPGGLARSVLWHRLPGLLALLAAIPAHETADTVRVQTNPLRILWSLLFTHCTHRFIRPPILTMTKQLTS